MDQQKIVDSQAEQARKENQDLRLQVLALNEKIKQIEYSLDTTQKQNDDLRYDNTVLYEKNIQKDEKIIQLNDELLKSRDITQNELNQRNQTETDNKYLQRRVDELEHQLLNEKQGATIRQKQNDELIRELDRQKKILEEEIALRNIDNENLRRLNEEQSYDLDNQRKIMAVKQEEINSLNKIISQQSTNNNELVSTIKDLELNIKEVEDKNKRLVELLNSTMYNKAEQYKERVLNKLQERNPNHGITPHKMDFQNSQLDPSRPQPSPIRIQKLLNDDKDQILKDRERLLRMADQLTKSQGQPQSQGLGNFRPQVSSFISPFSNQNESQISPSKSVHFADQTRPAQPLTNGFTNQLRMSDLSGGLPNGQTSQDPNTTSFSRENETSPERVADLMRQSSPLRQKLTSNPQGQTSYGYSNTTTPNKNILSGLNDTNFGPSETEQNLSTGNFTATKMTSKLLSSQLEELKQRMAAQQQDKLDLDRRLQEYQSSQLRRQQ